jgi:hypothetical protein
VNVNFLMLVRSGAPVVPWPPPSGRQYQHRVQTTAGFSYQVQ